MGAGRPLAGGKDRPVNSRRDHAPFRRTATFLAALVVAAGVGAALVLPGCSGDAGPSVILIIMDTTRYDRFGCTDDPAATTPTLDSLATAGVRFAQAVTAAPVTGPAITSILTGVYPAVHGVRDNRRFVINPRLELLAEAFRKAGYRTGAVVGAVPLLGRFGYRRGFERYDDRFAEDAYLTHDPAYAGQAVDLRESERRATAVTDHGLEWLGSLRRGQPFFLLAHYFDPHGPYDPPPHYAALHPDEPYDGEIAYMDAEIGRLLAGARTFLRDPGRLCVVAVADHGEGLFDHDEMGHGFFLYDTTVRVPLIMSGPGAAPGLIVRNAVRTIDVAPTLCSWCGVPIPATCTGVDLVPALAGGPVPATCDTAYIETFWTQLHYSWSPLQALRTPAWKWIRAPRPELYDLHSDPAESANLAGGDLPEQAALATRLDSILAGFTEPADRLGASPADVDPDLDRKLKALGYVSGQESDDVRADYDLPDPKDGNRDWNREERRQQHLQAARRYYENQHWSKALRRLEMAAALGPLEKQDEALLGVLLARAGRYEESLVAYRRALATEDDPAGRSYVRLELVRLLVHLGRLPEARAQAETLRTEPAIPEAVRSGLQELSSRLTK
jgi:choline-sulfatase